MIKQYLTLLCLLCAILFAQEYFPKNDGVKTETQITQHLQMLKFMLLLLKLLKMALYLLKMVK